MQPNSEQVAARRRLGAQLRGYREATGRSGRDVATALGWSQSKVSRIEQARTLAAVEDIRALLRELAVPVGARPRLLRLAGGAAGPPGAWRNSTGTGLTRRQQDFVALERLATTIHHYQPLLIPGYLQSEPYARRVLELSGVAGVDQAVELRLARQATLRAPDAPGYRVVLLEAVLRWRPGPESLLAGQLTLLAELAELSNVDVRVLRLDRPQVAYLQHPCVVFDFGPGTASEALVEIATQDVRITDPAGVARLRQRIELLRANCASRAESAALIRAAATALAADPDLK